MKIAVKLNHQKQVITKGVWPATLFGKDGNDFRFVEASSTTEAIDSVSHDTGISSNCLIAEIVCPACDGIEWIGFSECPNCKDHNTGRLQ